jgi:uncharacterized linocin/CFP29 family protein
MNHLLREIAPVTESGWARIDDEARQHLSGMLAARKLVDYSGPYGWGHSSANLGRVKPIAEAGELVVTTQRVVLPLVEFRTDFGLSLLELADNDRGALDLDLKPLDEAARRIAVAENAAVFHGLEEAGIRGIAEASPQPPIPLGDDIDDYPRLVAQAVEALRVAGIAGSYGLALGPPEYTGVVETTEHGGYPMLDHLRHILDGPVVWAPGVRGAVVVSLRGGDYLFESGQDLSIGYHHHDADTLHLYFEESFAFRIGTPEAAVSLKG